jgi:hypothetical protein
MFRVHSSVRPFAGTFGDIELLARRLAAGLRAVSARRHQQRGAVLASDESRYITGIALPVDAGSCLQ